MCDVFNGKEISKPEVFSILTAPEDKTDYELGPSAVSAQHASISGFDVASVPVMVHGRLLYDTSVARDGRLLYWHTSSIPPKTLDAVVSDLLCSIGVHEPENGIYGTYYG